MPDSDLFGWTPAQGDLFADAAARPVDTTPDPDEVRRRLHGLLAQMRAADAMPWPEREARMWQTVFPNMANWLPEEEAAQLRFAFAKEVRRLTDAA